VSACVNMYSEGGEQTPMDTLLLRPVEVGEQLRVSRAKAYELIASGQIPSIKVGGSTRVPADGLRDWINRQVSERAETGR
jgi:excisionase family DNA binding protein